MTNVGYKQERHPSSEVDADNRIKAMIYLYFFRWCRGFIHLGKDGYTPAMRLVVTKQPLGYEDILWPGQRVPQPKRSRRRGLRATTWGNKKTRTVNLSIMNSYRGLSLCYRMSSNLIVAAFWFAQLNYEDAIVSDMRCL